MLTIEGEELSLNDIEHRILRPIWQDPIIHYALNCASMGCPNLQPLAFTAKNTDSLLETGASEYINHPRGFLKFLNGIRMIMAAMKQEFYFIYRNMQKGIGLIL